MRIFALDRSSIIEDYEDKSILKELTEGKKFNFVASRHEYFIVQLLLFPDFTTEKLEIITGPLIGGGKEYIGAVTCFNSEGISFEGKKFNKPIPLKRDILQPIFLGFNFSRSDIGLHTTTVKIGKEEVVIELELTDKLVFNEGTDNKSTLSRLKWLNSNAARNISITEGLEALDIGKKQLKFSGKTVALSNDGLIENVESYFNKSIAIENEPQAELFYKPMEILIDGKKIKYNKLRMAGRINSALLISDGKADGTRIDVEANILYEGAITYRIKITAEKDFITSNIKLKMYFKDPQYIVGLGGRARKIENIERKWDGNLNQNSFFIGNVNCGARIKFEGSKESKTVVGFFKQCPLEVPDTWNNGGLGGLSVNKTDFGAELTAYTGRVIIPAKKSIQFDFHVHLTPFKPINLRKSLSLRVGRDQIANNYSKMIERAKKDRVTYLNITYGGELNPYLNYPFPYIKALASLSKEAHEKGLGLSISYNLRDISVQNREIYAYKALGDELILRLKDSSFADPRLSEELGRDVLLAKVVRYTSGKRKGFSDFAVVTAPSSRMDNYYIEGLDYLIKNADINAVSLRDANLNRTTIERIKKIIGRRKGIPGIIEMQISDQFNENSGYSNSLNYYTDVLPFLDKVWLDRSFEAMKEDPEVLLIEASGLPYGLAVVGREKDSISKCLLYACLPKYGLEYEVSDALGDMYSHLDNFQVQNAIFRGYWDEQNPFKTDKAEVLCSTYQNGENMIAVFYNFAEKPVDFEIGVENKLGYTTVGKKIRSLEIAGMQKSKKINLGKQFRLNGHSGLIIEVTK